MKEFLVAPASNPHAVVAIETDRAVAEEAAQTLTRQTSESYVVTEQDVPLGIGDTMTPDEAIAFLESEPEGLSDFNNFSPSSILSSLEVWQKDFPGAIRSVTFGNEGDEEVDTLLIQVRMREAVYLGIEMAGSADETSAFGAKEIDGVEYIYVSSWWD